ncbi:hypothetical protein HXA34_08880 [Salipaludibacillus agaradhaerens]|uniref:hypothetical protein n=1 Tax=Salipaludibacillus agaradhaerens TaxID=76935 RepID=UPI0014736277|nr:hypothetical protein [Salipaludibacillus agaradhaerens]MCR6106392.1 hypothetical protein [Salipaludibacillus agaradhaerens]MCR6118425.1 hypothetical protein [Salipaludibacillus agaradhaerens]
MTSSTAHYTTKVRHKKIALALGRLLNKKELDLVKWIDEKQNLKQKTKQKKF